SQMSHPFVRRTATITAGVAVFAGIAAAPIAAFADTPATPSLDAVPSAFPAGSVNQSPDPDGTGTLFSLNQNVQMDSTIQMPADATLTGHGHPRPAVEDATNPNFPGAVIESTPGDGSSTVGHLNVKHLHITTENFTGSNSGGGLAGIAMYRTSGSISHVTV